MSVEEIVDFFRPGYAVLITEAKYLRKNPAKFIKEIVENYPLPKEKKKGYGKK